MSQLAFTHAPGTATLSDCGRYRYTLFRSVTDLQECAGLDAKLDQHLCWLMLNPSTADAEHDDPTIRKVLGFTSRAGFGGAWVVNLFAWRSTDPRAVAKMLRCGPGAAHERRAFVEGPDNEAAIASVAARCAAVVCAWGASPWAEGQAARVVERLSGRNLLCLGHTKSGAPLHPLMPSYDGHPFIPYGATGSTLAAALRRSPLAGCNLGTPGCGIKHDGSDTTACYPPALSQGPAR